MPPPAQLCRFILGKVPFIVRQRNREKLAESEREIHYTTINGFLTQPQAITNILFQLFKIPSTPLPFPSQPPTLTASPPLTLLMVSLMLGRGRFGRQF